MTTSQSSQRKPRYIYELPYLPHRDLARILDDNYQWKDLGGVHLSYDVTTLNAFGRTESPTSTMLSDWGQKNHTVTELFVALSRMHHYRALEILKPYVEEKYHVLINEGEMSLTRLLRTDQGMTAYSSRIISDRPSKPNTEKPLADACNFNLRESGQSLTSKKLINFGDYRQNSSSQPIAIGNQSNNNSLSKSDNLQVPLGPSPKAISLSPQLGPVNSPKFRRDSDGSVCSDLSSASAMSSIPPIDEVELAVATNQWSSVSILGKGGFGTVYKGLWKNTQVAIKRMENKGLAGANIIPLQQSMGELRILNAVRHDNVLPLYGYSLGGDFPCLVYQFMPNGSLEDRLLCRQAVHPLTWEQRLNVARGTACGLQFLHTMSDKPLIHGDIKSANILLDKNFEPKIGDFGLAREGPQTHYTHIKVSRVHGTRPYLPDEYLRGRKISTKVDTYSFGIVLYELGTGLRAYDHLRANHYLRDHIENSDCNLLRDLKAGQECVALYLPLMHIGNNCSASNPKDRPEMVKVLKDLNHLAVQTEEYVTRKNSLTSSSPRNPYQVTGFSPPAAAFPLPSPRPVLLPTIQSENYAIADAEPSIVDEGLIPNLSRLEMPSAEEVCSAEIPNLSEFIAISTNTSIHDTRLTVSDLSSELPSSDEDYRQQSDSVSSVPTREKIVPFLMS